MKGTEQFKQTIKAYLDERAKTDELFAVSYAKENKNLDDCITFVLNQVMAICKEGGCGMTDDEVYSLCTHYYDEDNIEVGKAVNCGVIVNHRVETRNCVKSNSETANRSRPRKRSDKNPNSHHYLIFDYESKDEITA